MKFEVDIDPQRTIVVAHADHDGIAAAAGLIKTLGLMNVIFSQRAVQASARIPPDKDTVILADVMGRREWVLELLRRGKRVVNLDHHDPLHIKHQNYITFNPKLEGKFYVSSSTLVWNLFRPKEIAWALAAGAVADICAEGSMELICSVVDVQTWRDAYYTALHDVGWAMLHGNPYQMLREVLSSSLEAFSEKHVPSIHKLKESMLEELPGRVRETDFYVLIDSRGLRHQGGYSVVLNLKNGDERFYIEVGDRRTYFRNFFGDYDVAALAKRLGGGGTHPRTGSAPVTDVKRVVAAIKQLTLF